MLCNFFPCLASYNFWVYITPQSVEFADPFRRFVPPLSSLLK